MNVTVYQFEFLAQQMTDFDAFDAGSSRIFFFKKIDLNYGTG